MRYNVATRFGAKFFTTDWEPTYNAAPSQLLPVILGRNPLMNREHEILLARWGFQPSWATHWRPQNKCTRRDRAREAHVPRCLPWRHCLVLADGYYEWKPVGCKKQPYRYVPRNREPFAMAGIWENFDHEDEPPTFAILTTKANELAAEVHDRMPVILPISAEHHWLTQTGHGVQLTFPLTFPADEMRSYPVTPKMNKYEPEAIASLVA